MAIMCRYIHICETNKLKLVVRNNPFFIRIYDVLASDSHNIFSSLKLAHFMIVRIKVSFFIHDERTEHTFGERDKS